MAAFSKVKVDGSGWTERENTTFGDPTNTNIVSRDLDDKNQKVTRGHTSGHFANNEQENNGPFDGEHLNCDNKSGREDIYFEHQETRCIEKKSGCINKEIDEVEIRNSQFSNGTKNVEILKSQQDMTDHTNHNADTGVSVSCEPGRLKIKLDDVADRNESERALQPKDLETIWNWNKTLPTNIRQCMHEIISARASQHPNSQAVDSWDGSLTYGQVESLSDSLAVHILSLGKKLDIIPLCFEKSMWTVVAVLATMKVGAAFALMDPVQPEARLRSITEQVGTSVMLCSRSQYDLASRLAPDTEIIVVGNGTIIDAEKATLPSVDPRKKMYIQFTSGSTGTPKGVVISHAQYTSGAIPRSEMVGYVSTSRVLDFASYAFDVSIDCMLCTLARGGCICVPSDEMRINDLAGCISGLKVNMAHMTPSVARVLGLETISTLSVLGLGGESVTAGDAALWTKHTRVIIAYGPSECTVGCTINGTVVPGQISPNIGKGVGGVIWIVDPENHHHLTPVGEVGELLVEGPIVGDGYLNDAEKTKASFVEDPKWLLAGYGDIMGRKGKLYKTGDLVKYDEGGAIVFVGRKDTQVKLRGQRVELSEIEHHLRLNLPQSTEVAAEVIFPKSVGAKPTLVAFMVIGEETAPRNNTKSLEAVQISTSIFTAQWIANLEDKLSKSLPIYMVPTSYIPVTRMPLMVSGKLDRKQLRQIGGSLSLRQLAALRITERPLRMPESESEIILSKIWTGLLGIEIGTIAATDNFFGLGGDSILVMRLVSSARSHGLTLRADDVFRYPRLSDMALHIQTSESISEDEILPFSLLGTREVGKMKAEAASLCAVDICSIEDIYSCTPLQEALMALSAKTAEAYVAQRVVEVPNEEAEARLIKAWEITVARCPILRTRIIYAQAHGLFQVIVNEKIDWRRATNLEDYLEDDKKAPMELGSPLARYAIITTPAGKRNFVWSIHHALYDGWSMHILMNQVNLAYEASSPSPLVEFKLFIRYLTTMDRASSADFWLNNLSGAGYPQFPNLPHKDYEPAADSLLERRISLLRENTSIFTPSTIIRSAWTLVTSDLTNSTDVTFGETLIGRSVPIVGVDQIQGPMITTIPVRTILSPSHTIHEFLEATNSASISRMPHEHFGLQHIRRLSSDTKIACELRTGLVIQPGQVGDPMAEAVGLEPVNDREAAKEALKFNSYTLMLVCSLEKDGFLVMASFDQKAVSTEKMEKILVMFDNAVQKLCGDQSQKIESLLTHNHGAHKHMAEVRTPVEKTRIKDVCHAAPSALETQLQQFWSSTLDLSVDEISRTDHFFSIGGDSISAMKLVATARMSNYTLTVADIFRNPILCAMALLLEPKSKPEGKPQTQTTTPRRITEDERKSNSFSALNLVDIFLEEVVKPQLSNPAWEIQDVLPTTELQQIAIHATINKPRFSVQYNVLYLPSNISLPRLLSCFQQLVRNYEILRTVFIQHQSLKSTNVLQVVLKDLELPVNEYESQGDYKQYVSSLCEIDIEEGISYGTSILKLFPVKTPNQQCLIFRLSHAQYDGISLPALILQLKDLYEGRTLQYSPSYSDYIYHITSPTFKSESSSYWSNLLAGSKLSVFPTSATFFLSSELSKAARVKKAIRMTNRPKEFTTSTFMTAAWSLTLARQLETKDVVFGQVVTGRNIDFPDVDKVIGCCDNHAPVRVIFQEGWTASQLLRHIQEQRIASSRFEASGLREIAGFVGWDSDVRFDSIVHHEGIQFFDDLVMDGESVVVDEINPHETPSMEWRVRSWSRGDEITVEIEGPESEVEFAGRLMESLVGDMQQLCAPEGMVLSFD